MAIESKRGCGYRKVGGLYIVSDGPGFGCGGLPFLLDICPTCGGGIKQSRGWQWINAQELFSANGGVSCNGPICGACPVSHPEILGKKAGLLWIGEGFYKTPLSFQAEASKMGISRRIQSVPRGFEIGTHYVLLAHPKAIQLDDGPCPGIFMVFKPARIEKIVTESESRDDEAMAKLKKQGITPIAVPDDDPDHQGSVYDKKQKDLELEGSE